MTRAARWRGRRWAVIFGTVVCLAALALGQEQEEQRVAPDPAAGEGARATPPTDAEDSGPIRRFVYLDEDFEVNDLVHKAQFFEMQDNWPKAFQIYHQVLQQAKETTLVRLDDRTFGNLRAHVRRHLALMPPDRLHQYRLLYDGAAQRLLQEALTPLSVEGLERVATRYFATSVGDDALDILGDVYRERGERQRAIARWRQVLEVYPDTDLPRPLLWVKVVTAYIALGDGQEALAALERLRAVAGEEGMVRIAGTPTPLAVTLDRQIARLADAPRPSVVDQFTWPQVGGTAQHAAVMPDPGPADVRTWVFRLPTPPALPRGVSPLIGYPVKGQAAASAGQMCPVTSGGLVFVHDRQTVYAIDGVTGKLVWSHKGTLVPVTASADPRRRVVMYRPVGQSLPQTACAVDGGRVYAVLGGLGPVRPTVVALDQRTGRLIWSAPVPSGSDRQSIAVTTSEVVVAGGTVLLRTAAMAAGTSVSYGSGHLDHHVVAFDAATGKVRWNRFVCTAAPLYSRYGIPYLVAVSQLSVPAADEQRVYISTNGGAVAALDVRTGEVVWATLYEKATTDRTAQAHLLIIQRTLTTGQVPEPPWRSSAPMLVGRRVFVTPMDADALFCLDAETGRLLWQRPRQGGQFVVGAHDGRLFAVGKAVAAVDAATGKTLWRRAQPELHPTGHPFLTESVLFVPTEARLYRYDTRTGQVTGVLRFDPRDPAAETGSLVWTGRTLVTASATAINGFGDRTRVMADLVARVEGNVRDAEAFFQMGEIHARSEEHEAAIRRYEQGLAVCPPDLMYQASHLRDVLRGRLYEHHYDATKAAAGQARHEHALVHARACVGYATSGPLRLSAKLLMVASYERLGQWREAADTWQSVLLDEPKVTYALEDGSSTTASAVARKQLAKLIADHGRGVYAAHDVAAQRLLAAGDRSNLERVLTGYPNSLAYLPAMRALGDVLHRAGDFRRAVSQYRRYLRLDGPTARAQTYARMIEAQMKAGMGPSARRSLDRLLAERPDETVVVDGREVDVRAYVAMMRAQPAIAAVSGAGQVFLPDLSLPLDRAWTKPFPGARFLDVPSQVADRDHAFFVFGSTLGSLDGRTGKERWQRQVPGISNVQRFVGDGTSILVADNARVACLDLDTGQVEWVRSLPEREGAAGANPAAAGQQLVFQVQGAQQAAIVQALAGIRTYLMGLALSDQGALLTRRHYQRAAGRAITSCEVLLLDRNTGQVLWARSFSGYPQQTPLLLDDTALVCVQNPNGMLALEIDDGAVRHEWQFGNTARLQGPPIALTPDVACVAVGSGAATDVTAVDLQDGGVAWKQRIAAQGISPLPVTLEPRGDRLLYLPRRGACAALDARSGKVLWTTRYPGDAVSYHSHVIASEEAIFAAGQTAVGGKRLVSLTRIDTASGAVTWSMQLPETGQVRDVQLSAEHVVVAMSPQRTTTRQIGNRRTTTIIGLPPQVFLINQDDGQVDSVLKVSREGANARFTHQPAWLALSAGHAIVSHYGGLVAFGPARKKD